MQKDTEIEQLEYEFSNLKSKRFLTAAFRSVLRNFPMLTMSGNLDASDKHLFPQCRVLLTAFVALTKREEEKLALLRTVVDSSKYKDRFFQEEPESSLADAIINLSKTAAWLSIDRSISSVASAEKQDDIEFILKNDRHPYFDNQAALALISRKDLRKSSDDMLRTELWNGWKPTVVDESPRRASFRAYHTDDRYKFWREWHQGFVDGTPLEWELQQRVSQIEETIWESGPEAVAFEIERIKAEMLAEKLPLAETIELNPETGKFRTVPIPVENTIYMSALFSQISDALEDCLGGHNGLSERSGDIRKLNRVLSKYKDDPQNAELTLTRVAGSLRMQLHDSRELPDNEDNLALLNAVEESVRGIRANHPEVAANREQLAQQAFKALAPEDRQFLEDAQPILAALSDPDLAGDFEHDIPELINDAMLPLPDGAPRLPAADAATRIFSRASKMATLWDQLNAARESKAYRLAEIGVTASAAGTLLYQVVSLGLRLLGVI